MPITGTINIINFATILNLVGGRSNLTFTIPGWVNFVEGSSDQQLIDGFQSSLVTPYLGDTVYLIIADGSLHTASITLGFNQTSSIITLDGGSPINYSQVPTGLLIYDGTFYCSASTGVGSGSFALYINNIFKTSSGPFFDNFFIYHRSVTVLSLLQDIWRIDLSSSYSAGSSITNIADFNGFTITGSYVQTLIQWSLDNSTIINSGNVIITGSNIPGITTGIKNYLNGNETDKPNILIQYEDISGNSIEITLSSLYIINWTKYILIFHFDPRIFPPDKPIPPTVDIVINGTWNATDGTTFSGKLTAGTLSIVIADASGIYNISTNKRTDTLYDRNGTTEEVKIPNPFIKGGYIGG